MKKIFRYLSFTCVLAGNGAAQEGHNAAPPRLVVGIVVDQMRNDYIHRYWPRFGQDGFRRLVSDGYYFRNAHFNYTPTYTGPGHASVYTGTTPRHHGIVANNWPDRESRHNVYCSSDPGVTPVGTSSEAGRMSPRMLIATTVTDELRLATSKKGKVFAVGLKDRSSVLPGGHMSNGSFWFDEESGRFISSSFYMKELPDWVKQFNDGNPVQQYLSKPWNTLHPIETYTSSLPDENSFESLDLRADKPVFPYELKNRKPGIIRSTPFGNSLTMDLALKCITSEALGSDEFPDMLCLSFSSTDIIGHAYGPRSVEVEDTYLRLDLEIARLLKTLDKEVGKDNYVVFLTADHGGDDVPAHLASEGVQAGYVYEKNVQRRLRAFCQELYKDSLLIWAVTNDQVYLDDLFFGPGREAERQKIEAELCKVIESIPGISAAYPSQFLRNQQGGREPLALMQNGYNTKRSGNIFYLSAPHHMDHGRHGTSHGSPYAYDTHVPVIFFGRGVLRGEDHTYVTITQIAPTVSEMLRIARPGACFADPLNNHFSKR